MRQASTQGKQCSGCCFPCLHPQSFRTRCQFTKNRFLIVMQRRQPALDFYRGKLQALVYDILPSTTAVFSYAIGSRKLSANEQLIFCWCSNSSKFITNNSNKTRRAWGPPTKFTPAQVKPQSFESRRNSFLYHVYIRALALGCFYSLINTQTFRRALTASVDSCAETESAPSVA